MEKKKGGYPVCLRDQMERNHIQDVLSSCGWKDQQIRSDPEEGVC